MKVVWLLSALFFGWAAVTLPQTALVIWADAHDRLTYACHVILTIVAADLFLVSAAIVFGLL